MSVYQFLSILPAILAVLGFVAFTLLRGRILENPVVRDIVAKLRTQVAIDPKDYATMTPASLRATVEAQRALLDATGKQDAALLERILRQEFVIRVVVYAVLAAIFFFGVSMYVYQVTRPKKLAIDGFRLESDIIAAKGLAVDTDTLMANWTADGPAEDVRVYLENSRTNKKTSPLQVSSAEGKVTFPTRSFQDLLVERKLGESNPIRIVIQGREEVFKSQEVMVFVGTTINIIPWLHEGKVTVASLVDNKLVQGLRT